MDISIKSISLLFGALFGVVFGDDYFLLGILVGIVLADYITGVIAGATTEGLSSKLGFHGIAKKVTLFIIVAVAHSVDLIFGNKNMFRDATIFFYLANEIISILENAARMDVLIPDKLKEGINHLLKNSGENLK